jgi:hypothetical protein
MRCGPCRCACVVTAEGSRTGSITVASATAMLSSGDDQHGESETADRSHFQEAAVEPSSCIGRVFGYERCSAAVFATGRQSLNDA